MRSEVLRAATLCLYGNEFLGEPEDALPCEVLTRIACFKGVRELDFTRPGAHAFAAPGAGFAFGSRFWFRRMRTEGVESFRLHLPLAFEQPLPAVWGLVTDGGSATELWAPGPEGRYGPSKTEVMYEARRFSLWSIRQARDVAAASEGLKASVESLKACSSGAEPFVALAKGAATPAAGLFGFEDSVPPTLPGEARGLAISALRVVLALTQPAVSAAAFPLASAAMSNAWEASMIALETAASASIPVAA